MAITYGMSVKEFWEDDPDLFWMYRFSYFTRMEEQQKLFNQNAWLQGSYFYNALTVALNNSFSKTKIEYPKLPYGMDNKNDSIDKQKQQNDLLVAKLKGRISQVQAIKGKENSTTLKGNTKGGE